MSKSAKPKSHLSLVLHTLLEKHNLTAAEINRKQPKLLNSFLSRILRGDQTSLNPRKLALLVNCFTDDIDRANIIAAHCKDACHGLDNGQVVISINPKAGFIGAKKR
jgi:hypothetical protein